MEGDIPEETAIRRSDLSVVLNDLPLFRGLDYEFVARWITLDVHSALDAVGLTAAFATALAAAGISCNVLAGYHHDHVLVDTDRASEAVSVLERLAAFARQDDGGSD